MELQRKNFSLRKIQEDEKKKKNIQEIIDSQKEITPNLSEENIISWIQWILKQDKTLSQVDLRKWLIQLWCNRTFEQRDEKYPDPEHPLYILSWDITNLMISWEYCDRFFHDSDKDGNILRQEELKRIDLIEKNIQEIKES